MTLPTLSVVLPNYNHARYLPECLDSIFAQSLQPLEIILIDDASTDNSVAVIGEFARKHPTIRFFKNDRNRGVNFGMNHGLELARGDYVYYCAADDVVLPGLFEKSLRMLAQNPLAGLCCSNPASFVAEPGGQRKINVNRLRLSEAPAVFTPGQMVAVGRRLPRPISGMSVMKRAAIQEAGGFLDELKWHSDFFLVFQIVFRHGICYLPEELNLWRATAGSYLATGMRDWRAQQAVVERILELLHTEKYRDVLPGFRDSGVLAFTPRVTFTILAHRKYWPFLNFALLRRAVPADIFWLLPHPLQRMIRNLRARLA